MSKLFSVSLTLCALLNFGVGASHAASGSLVCKTFQGRIVIDTKLEMSSQLLDGGMLLEDFERTPKAELVKVTSLKGLNLIDQSRVSGSGNDIVAFFSRNSETEITMSISIAQEDSTDDHELDQGKGISVEIDRVFQQYEIVRDRPEQRMSMAFGISIGRFTSYDHGDDNMKVTDVTCKMSGR